MYPTPPGETRAVGTGRPIARWIGAGGRDHRCSQALGRAPIREVRCDLAGCRRCQATGFAPEMRDGVRASCAGSRLSFRSRKCARCTRPGHEISAPARSRRASL
jgi:hypothetical protein